MMKSLLVTTALATFAAASAVSAATLSYVGTGQQITVNDTKGNNVLGLDGVTLDIITHDLKSAANGLFVDGPAKITYELLDWKAANSNETYDDEGRFFAIKNGVSSEGDIYEHKQFTAGLLDFAFGTVLPLNRVALFDNAGVATIGGTTPITATFAVAYFDNGDGSFTVYFDDIESDFDYDDMAMRITVSAVPLPAGALLLLSGLGAAAAMRRRTKKA